MSWLIVLFGFCLLVILHEAGHFFAAKATGMRVERFFLFFGPKIASFKRGETEYGIAAIPLGGYVKISGMNPEEEMPPEVERRAYYRQPVWKRILVIGAGPAVNIGLAFVIFFFIYLVGATNTAQTVGEIVPGSPAARTLKKGDRILSVDGKAFRGLGEESRLEHFSRLVASHKCVGKQTNGCTAATPVILRVVRGGRTLTISAHPEYEAALGRTRIGFTYGTTPANLSIGAAAGRAGESMWLIAHKTASVIANIFNSQDRKQVSGIVGFSDVAHQEIGIGAIPALALFAFLSLSLGLINLLPFLPLDGGHIFWSLVEKIRGEPVSLRVMEGASMVGFALVAMLVFIGLSNDIGRLTGAGFNVR